jgi:hypothetical protein
MQNEESVRGLLRQLITEVGKNVQPREPVAAPEISDCDVVKIVRALLPKDSELRQLVDVYALFHFC